MRSKTPIKVISILTVVLSVIHFLIIIFGSVFQDKVITLSMPTYKRVAQVLPIPELLSSFAGVVTAIVIMVFILALKGRSQKIALIIMTVLMVISSPLSGVIKIVYQTAIINPKGAIYLATYSSLVSSLNFLIGPIISVKSACMFICCGMGLAYREN